MLSVRRRPECEPCGASRDDVLLLTDPDPPADPLPAGPGAASAAAEAGPDKDPAATAGTPAAAPASSDATASGATATASSGATASGAAATASGAAATACGAAAATTTASAAAAATPRQYEVLTEIRFVFPIEDVERRQTDVGNLLLAESHQRPGIVGHLTCGR
jgi:hypothetical protein